MCRVSSLIPLLCAEELIAAGKNTTRTLLDKWQGRLTCWLPTCRRRQLAQLGTTTHRINYAVLKRLSSSAEYWLLSRLPPGGRLSSKTLLTFGNSAPFLFNYVLHLSFVNKYCARILTGIGNAQQNAHSPATATSLWHVACTKVSPCTRAHIDWHTHTEFARVWPALDSFLMLPVRDSCCFDDF